MDATSYEVITRYSLPELSRTIIAVIRDTFYNIDTVNGRIMATNIEDIMNGKTDISWTQVGSFPPDDQRATIGNSVALNQQFIYFVNFNGTVFVYNTISRTVNKIGSIVWGFPYASLIVVNNVLYIYKHTNFYSFDGSNIREIPTPELKVYSALFQMGNNVCRVGGNITEVYPDPVSCYNPTDGSWSIMSYLNEARWLAGIATTESGTCVFGGQHRYNVDNSVHWRDSAEIFNHQTKTWSYIPSPLINENSTLQVTTFYF